MIVEERFLTYLRSLEGQEIDYIAEIEKEALATYVPIIRKDTQGFLKFLMQTLQPHKILEVGTAVGFSALTNHVFRLPALILSVRVSRNGFICFREMLRRFCRP